jgi:hypothetical protein
MAPPIHGREHKIHGIYIGGRKIIDDWELPRNYRDTSQQRNRHYVAKIERNLIERRDNIRERKFEGTLLNGYSKELDKDQFIRSLIQKVRDHGHAYLLDPGPPHVYGGIGYRCIRYTCASNCHGEV